MLITIYSRGLSGESYQIILNIAILSALFN